MKRLTNKKGFTLVEMIVVVAIIGIMLGILIPALSTSSSFEKEARDNSKAFYSNVQQLIIQEKFNKTPLCFSTDADAKKYTLVYATVKMTNTTTEAVSNIALSFADDLSSGFATPVDIDSSGSNLEKFKEFSTSLKFMLRSNDHDGYYYAVVDEKYRVVSAYYSRTADFSAMNNNSFSDEFRVEDASENEHIAGAFPEGLCDETKKTFSDPG